VAAAQRRDRKALIAAAAVEDSNVSGNPGFHAVSLPARRRLLQAGFASASALLLGCAGVPGPRDTRLGFEGIAADRGDRVTVPPGYQVDVIARWGEAVGLAGRMPAWRDDAGNSADEQALQLGMHHDGMAFFALDAAGTRGLLVINHEYADEGLLHAAGASAAERVRKSQAAHGLSVVEVALRDGHWQLLRPSAHARRITLATPITLSGPAAGHPLLRTAADPQGLQVLGTLNNCAGSRTPWGTYLAGEENWAGYFGGGDARSTDQRRWGLQPQGWSGWERHDERFDTRRHPNEFHRFGWIVELDPLDPRSTPVKRTALGRGAHEGAWVGTRPDGRAVVYSGEDARFEYLYRFVSRDRIAPGGARSNATLLDHGTLSVARFDADGRGRWLPLVQGQGPLTAANGFADQGQVLVQRARRPTCWAPRRWTAPSGWPSTRAAARSSARSPTTAVAVPTASPAPTPPTPVPATAWATSSAGPTMPTARPSAGSTCCWPATPRWRVPTPAATSTATPSPAPTAWCSTPPAGCGSAPTSAPTA
jgi:secreted PhoX family phosphatase